MSLAIVITVVVVALFFDYTNGFHDAANAARRWPTRSPM